VQQGWGTILSTRSSQDKATDTNVFEYEEQTLCPLLPPSYSPERNKTFSSEIDQHFRQRFCLPRTGGAAPVTCEIISPYAGTTEVQRAVGKGGSMGEGEAPKARLIVNVKIAFLYPGGERWQNLIFHGPPYCQPISLLV